MGEDEEPGLPLLERRVQVAIFRHDEFVHEPIIMHPFDGALLLRLHVPHHPSNRGPHEGALGVALFVLLPAGVLAALLRRQWTVLALAVGAVIFCALVFREQVYLRYALPALPLMLIAGCCALEGVQVVRIANAAALALVAVAVSRMPVAWHPLGAFPVLTFFSERNREDYVNRMQPPSTRRARCGASSGTGPQWRSSKPPTARARATQGIQRHLALAALPRAHDDTGGVRRATGFARRRLGRRPRSAGNRQRSGGAGAHRRIHGRVDRGAAYQHRECRSQGGAARPRVRPSARKLGRPRESKASAEVLVSLDKPAAQGIVVQPGSRVRLTVDYVCTKRMLVRSQINWHDAGGRFVGTSIEPAVCDGETSVSRTVLVPQGVESGIVIATPHEPGQVRVVRASAKVLSPPPRTDR